jgi:hypothetical protein
MSLFDGVITIAVVIWFGLLVWSKFQKKSIGECLKDILEWFKEKPEEIKEKVNPINNFKK